ncbi:MAG: tetraacyldisaccharide 4'-kinase [Parachlamydiales bacterium]|nr:tetraacyldisaccharide 4'-kinase [Parachlamydiales bacterium]
MSSSLERFIVSHIERKQKGLKAFCVRSILRMMSALFRAVVMMRNRLFDLRCISSKKCSVPVISIGNIVAGGTGKTPLTLMLTRALLAHSKVAILSRGYRSSAENGQEPLVLSSGDGPLFGPDVCGDEAYMLSKNLPKALVVVGRNRRRAAEIAFSAGAELLVLDDGMQHRKLHRDIEIVVINGHDPFGQDRFLPSGFLRDEPKRLKNADCVIVNYCRALTKENRKLLQLRQKNLKIIGVEPIVTSICDRKGQSISLKLEGRKVGLFSGIAKPARFKQTVEVHGAHVVHELILQDHMTATSKDLQSFVNECKNRGAEFVLCTEKDYVKLPHFSESLPLFWIQISLVFKEGEEHWFDLLKRLSHLKTVKN